MTVSPSRCRWLIRGAVALAVCVVLFVGGPFVYIHFIEGKPPPKLTLPASTTTTTSGGAGGSASTGGSTAAAVTSVVGDWHVGPGSTVGYRVGEVLFGQDNTAVGRTTAVSGDLVISGSDSSASVSSGSFTAQMAQVKSSQSQRDGQFDGRIMDVATYPTATFTLTRPIDLATVPAVGVPAQASATGTLELRGVKRTVTIPLTVERVSTGIEVLGDYTVVFADWNIPNPSFGPVTTNSQGTLEFLLDFTPGASSAQAGGASSADNATPLNLGG
ncbi:MAG: YceI family protein [Acidimicrobiales bacterium]